MQRTARTTGFAYLALALTGMLGFLVVRPRLYVDGDPAATLQHLVEDSTLAHLGVGVELLIVATQALAALCFYRLFASVNRAAAVGVLGFGLMNTVAIMASATFMATAVGVADDPALAPGGDPAATIALLAALSTNAWGTGAVFFGLWLIPMGWVAVSSGRMPRVSRYPIIQSSP
ncbi:MAG TPA: DUF4386 domain-containing protein, partial [Actinoplanes sp.]|nr:DUF4386 domain-containing protein [Actinoplanes sp.]